VREPVDGEGIADAESARDVTFVASIMLGGRADIPAIYSVRRHVGSLLWRDVHNDACAGRCKRSAIEIEVSIEGSVGGEAGLTARGAKEI
jgi:hypothetical protein